MNFKTIILKTETSILKFLESNFWIEKVVLLCILLAIIGAFPRYDYIYAYQNLHRELHGAWYILQCRSEHLMDTHVLTQGDSHIGKLTFRLVLPILLGFFHKNIWGIVVVQAVLGTFSLWLLAKLIYKITDDKLSTFYFTLATTHIYFGIAAFWELGGFGDSIAYAMIIIAMFYRNPFIIFSAISIASWTDERGFIAGGYILLWWIWRNTFEKQKAIREAYTEILSTQTLSIVSCWCCYIAIRLWLTQTFHLTLDTRQIGAFMLSPSESSSIGLGLWASLEGFWLFIGITTITLIANWKQTKLSLFIYIGILIFLILTSCMVSDINRSISYGFSIVLCSLILLKNFLSKRELHYILAGIATICVAHPLLMTFGSNKVTWAYPLPFQVLIFLCR